MILYFEIFLPNIFVIFPIYAWHVFAANQPGCWLLHIDIIMLCIMYSLYAYFRYSSFEGSIKKINMPGDNIYTICVIFLAIIHMNGCEK